MVSLSSRRRFIIHATLGYAIFAAAWIFLSDHLLNAFTDIAQLTMFGTLKGLVFVSVTTVLLFLGLQNVPPEDDVSLPAESLNKIGAHRIVLALLLPLVAMSLQWMF